MVETAGRGICDRKRSLPALQYEFRLTNRVLNRSPWSALAVKAPVATSQSLTTCLWLATTLADFETNNIAGGRCQNSVGIARVDGLIEREKPKIKRVPTELADKSKIQLSNHWPDGVVCNGVQLRHLVRSIVISTSARPRQILQH